MFETKNSIRQKDLEELAREEIFDSFKNQTILVTGATGLLGSEIVLALLCANRLKNLNIKVVALLRNIQKAQKVFSNVIDNPFLEIVEQDINDSIQYRGNVDYIVHAASVTASRDFVSFPVQTIMTAVCGAKNVLDFAGDVKAQSVVYLSSLEVYGTMSSEKMIKENDFGYIDLMNPRSCYSEGKRLVENLCISFGIQHGIDVKIARLAQTFGAGVDINDNRIFAQFAKSVLNYEDIILYTKGGTKRNYCYLTDAVSAILTILKKGEPSNAYNVANQDSSVSIKNMAELVAQTYGINVRYEIDGVERGFNPEIKVCLDTGKINSLGWEPKVALEVMFERMIESIMEERNELKA